MRIRFARHGLAVGFVALAAALTPASAATTTAPYDDTYSQNIGHYDALTLGDAEHSSTQDVNGAITVNTAARQFTMPIGTDLNGPGGKIAGLGTSEGRSRAGIVETVEVTGAGSVTVTINSITASVAQQADAFPASGIALVSAEASFAFYPCAVGNGCAGTASGADSVGLASTGDGSSAPSSVTLSFSAPGAGHVIVTAGLRAVSYANGRGTASASASGTVASIAAP